MKIVGLTGGSGSGKGTVGAFFRDLGCCVIDTDLLYHSMINADSDCSRAIISRFGDSVKNANGGIDRRVLADIVFSDASSLETLNVIAHSYVRAECEKIIDYNRRLGIEILIIDAPQLFEAGMDKICDTTIAVTACEDVRVDRICARDGITRDKALSRIHAQYSDDFFRANCSYLIENDQDLARLLVRTKQILDEIKGL